MTSPALKTFGDERIAAGEICLVVDLHACTGMDSTFMGTLAGLANRVAARNGTLQIAEPGVRNRHSLEDLGLDFLMEIDPPENLWSDRLAEVRRSLRHPRVFAQNAGQPQHAKHVLEAHQELSATNAGNARKFASVVSLLEAELADPKNPQ